ncbi:MAG: hypothetical protein QOC61_1608 [Acidobacteriota bacterium]|nr:hypothetical protein [Acidobacteriota bacterium]
MKEGFDKEIDSLLRRRARGGTTVREDVDGARAPGMAAHLDADELGAFAEGVLPPSARIDAASHLADCDECRGIVVGLTRVAGVGAESEKHAPSATVPTVATWRAWLSTIFAPRVLRYGAPALALCVVAVVSFIALRSRRGTESGAVQIARNEHRQSEVSKDGAGSAASDSSEAGYANANVNGAVTQPNDNAPHNLTTANSSAQPSVGRGHGAAEAPPPAATDTKTDEAPAPPPPAAAKSEGPGETTRSASKAGSVEEGESARTENKDKTERRAEPANNEVASSDQPSQQRRGQSRANEVQMPDGSRNQKRSSENTTSNVAGGSGGSNDTVAASPKPTDRDSNMAKSAPAAKRGRSVALGGQRQDDDEALRTDETRSAAGHRFRREGGAWVDVNYKSSMSSTGVRRGTEAFRALVADIPEIGRIAEQFSGEVVVVVHGRAYRIR